SAATADTLLAGDPDLDLQSVADTIPQLAQVIAASNQAAFDATTAGSLPEAVSTLFQVQSVAQEAVAADLQAAVAGEQPLTDVIAANTGTALADQIATATVNVEPVAIDDGFTTATATTLDGNVLEDNGAGADTDLEGDTLSISLVNGASDAVGQPLTLDSGAVLTLDQDGTFTYTPDGDFTGTDSFTYTISDGNGGMDTASVTVTVDPSETGSDLNIGLYDADTDTLITLIGEGDEILASTLAGRDVTLAALVPDDSPFVGQVESMFLDLNEGQRTRRENAEPYALFGDIKGDFRGGDLPVGDNQIAFDLYSENGLRGELLDTVTRSFTIVEDRSPDLEIGLYDADNDTLITILEDGDELLASTLADRTVTLAAFVPDDSLFAGEVESMFLNLNEGEITRRENAEPYALFGDIRGDFSGGVLPIGESAIAFDLYSKNGLKGELLGTVTRDFTIVDDLI
ncbi:MAG: cadherin-like domain-containing protein, partial [Cyanobacteria bacterium J06559_3]